MLRSGTGATDRFALLVCCTNTHAEEIPASSHVLAQSSSPFNDVEVRNIFAVFVDPAADVSSYPTGRACFSLLWRLTWKT